MERILSIVIYNYHGTYGTRDAYKLTSSASNFIFTVVMKVQVKPSVLAKQVLAI